MSGGQNPAPAPSVTRSRFGATAGGEAVEAITLRSAAGISVTVISYGAGIQALLAPDRQGHLADVALGHATLGPYLEQPQYLGSTVGRVANRIAGGRFQLDGREYRVPPNNGPNALHGGPLGFDKANWSVAAITQAPQPRVTLAHHSPDGDQGFPGALRITATYELQDNNTLALEYRAETDRPTLVNITSHAYWNLGGEGSPGGAMDHRLQILAGHFLPTGPTAIPTGEFRPVAGTPFDFRVPTVIGDRARDAGDEQLRIGRGYDHNWVIARAVASAPRLVARLEHPGSGRVLELLSDQPGLQFYSGNFLDGTTVGKSGRMYRMGDAVALEPQMFPDTPNRPEFGSLMLEPGAVYRNRIKFRFTTEGTI